MAARIPPAKDQHAAGALAVGRGVRGPGAGRRASWGQLGPLVGLSKSGCTSCTCPFTFCPNARDILIHVRLSLRSLKRLWGYVSVSPRLTTWLCLHEASAEIYLHVSLTLTEILDPTSCEPCFLWILRLSL